MVDRWTISVPDDVAEAVMDDMDYGDNRSEWIVDAIRAKLDAERGEVGQESRRERETAPRNESTTMDADTMRERVREHFAHRDRMSRQTVDVVETAAAYLVEQRRRVRTKELKRVCYEEHGDAYDSEVTLWNSVDDYLAEIDGIEKPDYGEWAFFEDGLEES